MEKKSENLDFLKYREGNKEMNDAALARDLIRDIGGPGQVATVIYNTYTTLSRMFPHRDDHRKQWTARRIKSWWNNETDNVQYREMRELFQAAQAKKAEKELIREARHEHRKFIEKTNRLRSVLEHTDPDFFGDQIEGLGRQVGSSDCSGNRGDR